MYADARVAEWVMVMRGKKREKGDLTVTQRRGKVDGEGTRWGRTQRKVYRKATACALEIEQKQQQTMEKSVSYYGNLPLPLLGNADGLRLSHHVRIIITHCISERQKRWTWRRMYLALMRAAVPAFHSVSQGKHNCIYSERSQLRRNQSLAWPLHCCVSDVSSWLSITHAHTKIISLNKSDVRKFRDLVCLVKTGEINYFIIKHDKLT